MVLNVCMYGCYGAVFVAFAVLCQAFHETHQGVPYNWSLVIYKLFTSHHKSVSISRFFLLNCSKIISTFRCHNLRFSLYVQIHVHKLA